MPSVYLLLTSLENYQKALKRALEEAKRRNATLQIVFWINTEQLDEAVHNLGDRGWLGPGYSRRLEDELMADYRALAKDVLEEVQRAAIEAGVSSMSAIEETPLEAYLSRLLDQEASLIVIGVAHSSNLRLTKLPERVELIEEEEWQE